MPESRKGSHLDADVHQGRVGVHIAHDAVAAHLCYELQGLPKLLVGAALRDDGCVGVHIAQVRQLVVLWKPPQPVKQL